MSGPTRIHSDEVPEPPLLEPESLAKPKDVELDPRVREQGLPEKDDHRFMDRWSLDRAGELGERVVRKEGLEQLKDGTDEFGEWRALRHEVRRHQDGADDMVAIATSEARGETEGRRAERLEARSMVEEDKADGFAKTANDAEEERLSLSAALRGSRADLALWIVAKLVLFAVDILVLHQALRLTIGSDLEHWLTAGMIGAGVVVLGDIVGWAAAAGTVRLKGSFRAPAERVAIAVALIALLAVWFFVALGTFRSHALSELAELDGVTSASPGFFTLAQILFFVGAGACCYWFTARADGRELRKRVMEARGKEEEYRSRSLKLREEAEYAQVAAGNAPIALEAAKARQRAREAAAQAQATLDRQQAKYLQPLLESEYLVRRAEVESGLRFWTLEEAKQRIAGGALELGRLLNPAVGLAILTTAAVYLATRSGVIAGTAGLSVLLAIYIGTLVSARSDEPVEDEEGGADAFVAEVRDTPLPPDSELATEIEQMVPLGVASNGSEQDRSDGGWDGDSGSAGGNRPDA